MNVYLDIDGVLLDNEGRLAIGAIEFIIQKKLCRSICIIHLQVRRTFVG